MHSCEESNPKVKKEAENTRNEPVEIMLYIDEIA